MPRGITGKGLATRRRIIEGAARVLREQGTGGLEEIRVATGTSSSQLFHYFPGGKAELMLAVTSHEAGQVLEEQQPHLDDLGSWESWAAWAAELFARHERQREHCGLSVLIGRLDPNDPAGREIVVAMYGQWENALTRGIVTMQAAGKMRADIDAVQAAAALLAGIQGGILMMLATGTTSHLKAVLDAGLARLR
ncbi:TetR/AcrR family transcriptional regulator [Amycolatopsis sp.]|jgi:AcrR family transcriptional regulator|uniref:TetR/AcrR family transcriptional regulator n=1 Tax=Amycolatopsis sp. TaxID=37632 RepID=UPI002DFB198B|nr:TetR/AcrR family transcriptional regulator [Amycolatopsis sp.]